VSTADVAPWVAAAGGVVVAGLAGFWQSRQAKTAAAPSAQGALNDGFGRLIDDLRAEVQRLSNELKVVRLSLAAAVAEVEVCEEARKATEHRLEAMEAQMVAAGLMDRRKSNSGPPSGSRDRRSPQ